MQEAFAKESAATADGLGWKRSSFCSNGACVEIAQGDEVMVRDSKTKDVGAEVLRFTQAGWGEFVDRVRTGDYDAM